MIQFQFTKCPDLILLGTYEIDEKIFTLGCSIKAEIIIQDEKIEPIHLIFECSRDGLYVSSKDLVFFQLNNKKMSGKKLLKLNDKVLIGETEFVLTAYTFPEHIFLHSEIPQKYQEVKMNDPAKFQIIKELERLILNSEFEK
jgi:hypothetical protein